MFGDDGTAERRQAIVHAVCRGALDQLRLIAVAAGVVFTGGQLEVPNAFSQHVGHGRVGDAERFMRTVGLVHGDLQVTVVGMRIDVVDLERTRRDVGAVDDVTVLANFDAGVGCRHAAHHRRITAQAVRQHVVNAGELHPAELEAVEHAVVGARLPHHQTAAPWHDVGLGPGRDVSPAAAAAALFVPGGVVAQAPSAQVEAAVQREEHVLAVVGIISAIAVLVVVEVIVGEQRVDAFIVHAWRDRADSAQIHHGLRHGNVDLLHRRVIADGGVFNQRRQINAAAGLQRFRQFDAVVAQVFNFQAGLRRGLAFSLTKSNILMIDLSQVDVDVEWVNARLQSIALGDRFRVAQVFIAVNKRHVKLCQRRFTP